MRDTRYAEELATATVGENRIERLWVKGEQQEEIRLSWWPGGRMMPRPLDLSEAGLVALLAEGVREGVLSGTFVARLIAEVGR